MASAHGSGEDEIDKLIEAQIGGGDESLDADIAELERKLKAAGVEGGV